MQPFLLALLASAAAHEPAAVGPEESWQVRHMKLEHGYDAFDAKSFFDEHDWDNTKFWDRSDILRLYGLQKSDQVGDGTGMGTDAETHAITQEKRDEVVNKILELLDSNGDGRVSLDEWRNFYDSGQELPDFGLGTGHHGSYEHEYEVHHWKQYHAENDRDVKVRHPEDDEHERLYHQVEHHDNGWDDHGAGWVRTGRIPKKYLKSPVPREL